MFKQNFGRLAICNEEVDIIISAAEKLGFNKDVFDRLYDSCNGFDSRPNKNHPTYEEGETFEEFLKKGSKKVVEDSSLIGNIIKAF